MSDLALGNVWAWAVQVAAIAALGLVLPVLVKITSPGARLAYLRGLLLACLVLPLIQPWVPLQPPAPGPEVAATEPTDGPFGGPGLDALPVASTASVPDRPVWPWTFEQTLLGAAVGGAAARLAWLGLGLWSLGRLRRRGRPLEPLPEPVEDARLAVGAAADVLVSDAVSRPVTFGFRRPVVIVPEDYRHLAPDEQRTIAMHELLHVRRRDWVRTLGDEVIRAVLWFHPAIWWLTDQIQLGVEQVVDREVVRLSGARRPYLDALLKIAASQPAPVLQPASMFLKQRHLAQRVASLVKEASMSRVRLVASFTIVGILLVASGYFVVLAFPLRTPVEAAVEFESTARPAAVVAQPQSDAAGTAAPVQAAIQQTTPVVPPQLQAPRPGMPTSLPGQPAPPKVDEPTLRTRIQANPEDVSTYFALAKLLEGQGHYDEAEQTLLQARAVDRTPGRSFMQLASYHNRRGDFEKCIAALQEWAALEPVNPEPAYTLATFYWDKAFRDNALTEGDKKRFTENGLEAVDDALRLKPQHMEALTYKNLLLRLKASMEPDPTVQQALIAQADALRNQAIELRKKQGVPASPDAVRIGGDIKPPVKVKDVRPVYPQEARDAGVQGVVILEALIGKDGRVGAAKVLRSIPILDQAALTAVQQWEYEPTTFDGQPVPVVMTVTVRFTHSGGELAGAPPPPPPPPAPHQGAYGKYPYTGSPLTVDLTNAKLDEVLRMFEVASGLAIVGDPQAMTKADEPLIVKRAFFKDTPWDQALGVILRPYHLGYVIENNTIRLAWLSGVSDGVSGGVVGGLAGGGPLGGVVGSSRPGAPTSVGSAGSTVTTSGSQPARIDDTWYPPQAVRVGGGLQPPRKTLDVRPVYPDDARKAGVQGVVIVEAVIGTDGKVVKARALRSIPMLDQAALDAVNQWEFTPTELNGALVPVVVTMTVSFTLR